MSNNEEEVLANFSEVMQQYREENSSSSANDIFFGSNSSNSKSNNSKSNLLCIEYKKIKVHPNFSPYCGPMCKDYHESKTKYELKGLLMKLGD